jgi:hypothetical protein
MSEACHLCGSTGAGVIFSCIGCGISFCSVHHAKRSHGCKGKVAAPPITPVPIAAAEPIRAEPEISPEKKEPKLVSTLKENGTKASVAGGLFSSLPSPDARAAAAAATLLLSAPVVREGGGFSRPVEEAYIKVTHLAEAGKPAEAFLSGSKMLGELETEPALHSSVVGIAREIAPKVDEVDAALKSASRAVDDSDLYGAPTYDARVLLGRAGRNYREGHLDEALALAKHSRSAAKASLAELAVRLASRVPPGAGGLEALAREDAKAAIREASRFGGSAAASSSAEAREFVIATIAVSWDLVRQAKARGFEVTEQEINLRQARSAVDLADLPRASRLAARVRDEVELKLARAQRGT